MLVSSRSDPGVLFQDLEAVVVDEITRLRRRRPGLASACGSGARAPVGRPGDSAPGSVRDHRQSRGASSNGWPLPRPGRGGSSRRRVKPRVRPACSSTTWEAPGTRRESSLRCTGARSGSSSATVEPVSSPWPPPCGGMVRRRSSRTAHSGWTSADVRKRPSRRAATASSSPRARWNWESTLATSTA